MSRRIRRRLEVKADIIDIARYIAKDNFDAAMRFFDAVEEELNRLARMPGMGGLMKFRSRKLADVRSVPVKGFPNHLIIYRQIKTGIEVLAVVHGARNLQPIVKQRFE